MGQQPAKHQTRRSRAAQAVGRQQGVHWSDVCSHPRLKVCHELRLNNEN
jgi:hypothetical protein